MSAHASKPLRLQQIITAACKELGVDFDDFTSRQRNPRMVIARSVAAYIARRKTTLSYPEIARGMNRPTHTTIIAARKRCEETWGEPVQIGSDEMVGEVVERIEALVASEGTVPT